MFKLLQSIDSIMSKDLSNISFSVQSVPQTECGFYQFQVPERLLCSGFTIGTKWSTDC